MTDQAAKWLRLRTNLSAAWNTRPRPASLRRGEDQREARSIIAEPEDRTQKYTASLNDLDIIYL